MGKPQKKYARSVSAMAVDSSAELAQPQLSTPIAEASAPDAVAMEAEATKPKKPKGFFPIVVKKRGSSSKVQKKRKLKKLQKALSHQEKLVSKDAREKHTQAQRNAAKSLWDASKPDTNKFALLA